MNKILKTMMLAAVTAFGLASCEDVPAPFIEPEKPGEGEVIGAEGNGTLEEPFNVAAVIKYVQDLGADVESPEKVYIKGIVCSTKEISAQFGNATFDISADGELAGEKFTVYRAKGLNNQNIKSEDDVQVGDEVIVYGNVVNYKGNTPETTQGKAYIYWQKRGDTVLDGSASDTPDTPADGGTWDKPYTVAQAIANQTGKEVWVHGYIVGSIPADVSPFVLENMTFTADGASGTNICIADVPDETNYANCAPVQLPAGSDARTDLNLMNNPSKLGVEVWLKGKATTYFGAPGLREISKYTLTAPTAEDDQEQESGDEPVEGAQGDGSLENPFNAAAAYNYTAALPADQATSEKFYVKGIVCESSKMDINTEYKNATFHISDDGSANSTQFLIFRTKGLNGADITSVDDVQVGDEVVVYAQLVNYYGNTPETAKDGIIYSQKRNGQDIDGDTPGDDEGEGDQEDDDLEEDTGSNVSNFKASDLGLSNGTAFSEVTVQGVTISVDGGGNQNSPKYYNNGSNLRMYPQNEITFSTERTIKRIKLTCTSGYVASGDVETDKGTTSVEDPIIIINDIYDKTLTLTNTSTNTGAPSQVRIEQFEITYAE
ncbi:MAG: hypothetical protein J6S05_00365 [Bacteroidaceae bacterium]|nr:hypothetical protein [Bacteroidaceae bacterium]